MSQKNETFQNLGSAEELVGFLKKKGGNHIGGYFHYTGINALKGMLHNRKLHLSSGPEMNDLLEPLKGSVDVWKRLYIASFSVGNDENMAMWGIYGEPLADALRVKFRCKSLRDIIRSPQGRLYEVSEGVAGSYAYKPLDAKATVELVDVAYLSHSDRHTTIFWNGQPLRGSHQDYVTDLYRTPSSAGCLKNVAWQYERETRILVKLERAFPHVKRIAIDISEAFDDIEVLCGPCLKKEHLEHELRGPWIRRISDSQSLGRIHFRTKCDSCKSLPRCPNDMARRRQSKG